MVVRCLETEQIFLVVRCLKQEQTFLVTKYFLWIHKFGGGLLCFRVRLLNFIKFTSIRQKILRQLSLLFVIFSLVKIRLVRKHLKGPEVQNIINGLWTVLGWRLLKIKVNYFVLYILLYLCFRLRIYWIYSFN